MDWEMEANRKRKGIGSGMEWEMEEEMEMERKRKWKWKGRGNGNGKEHEMERKRKWKSKCGIHCNFSQIGMLDYASSPDWNTCPPHRQTGILTHLIARLEYLPTPSSDWNTYPIARLEYLPHRQTGTLAHLIARLEYLPTPSSDWNTYPIARLEYLPHRQTGILAPSPDWNTCPSHRRTGTLAHPIARLECLPTPHRPTHPPPHAAKHCDHRTSSTPTPHRYSLTHAAHLAAHHPGPWTPDATSGSTYSTRRACIGRAFPPNLPSATRTQCTTPHPVQRRVRCDTCRARCYACVRAHVGDEVLPLTVLRGRRGAAAHCVAWAMRCCRSLCCATVSPAPFQIHDRFGATRPEGFKPCGRQVIEPHLDLPWTETVDGLAGGFACISDGAATHESNTS
ncbi:uncharacterized protein M421DRAFT_134671 [Didymella exigua CBS 183.55]|uniref:Uncharacterized protein n=1 Tax=Didymella exigua CBS 183.55 TaxID=1150837 RepID=A0A6A5RNJ9_9PLEO|nr:uncharacterized protein M421DRAFT_134671 [Didymella exigua CBS 183.55]KAF1929229.1 hypothetical protein M421DRAFT_134671 [Didymella exigua CBS 183.55]